MDKDLELYKILNKLKNKNITEEAIIKNLSDASKMVSDITEIKKHNRDLLFFSCFHDNDNLFEYLANNYSKEFNSSYKECILFTYVNRNPKILKIALNKIVDVPQEDMDNYLSRFSSNCYRKENIEIVINWLDHKITKEQRKQFIINLFNHYNKPFLETATINGWSDSIFDVTLSEKHHVELQGYLRRFYNNNKITKQPNPNLDFSIERTTQESTQQPTIITSTQSTSPTLIVKKRRIGAKEV